MSNNIIIFDLKVILDIVEGGADLIGETSDNIALNHTGLAMRGAIPVLERIIKELDKEL